MILDEVDIKDIATGAYILGSGGGGNPQPTYLMATQAMSNGNDIKVISPKDVPDNALVVPVGNIGAPTISIEKLPNGKEAEIGLRKLEELLNEKAFAVMPVEIGGSNGLAPLVLAAQLGLPVVDCDGMGRAFPESDMVTYRIFDCPPSPMIVTDEHGNIVVIYTEKDRYVESIGRHLSIAMGGTCHAIDCPLSGSQIKAHTVHGSLTFALGIGRTIRTASDKKLDPFAALESYFRASAGYSYFNVLIDGKIVDVMRETKGGFDYGYVLIDGFNGSGQCLEITFQNENLLARLNGEVCAMVPDIISILDRETAENIGTDTLRYGQRVKVVGIKAPDILRTPQALDALGPKKFGFSESYQPVELIGGYLRTE